MFINPAIPLLAANFEVVGLIIFIAISIIGWLTNLANQKNRPPQPPPRQPRRAANDKLSQEIDVFLQEVSGRRKPSEPVQIELVPESEIRKRRADRRPAREPQRPQQRPQQRPAQVPQPARKPAAQQPRVRPGQEMSERHNIDPSRLGTSLQSHLSEYMGADRLNQEVQQHLNHDVEKSVEQHLGRFGGNAAAQHAAATTTTRTAEKAVDIVRLLRDPLGVRQAILINEVLSPPLGLRNR